MLPVSGGQQVYQNAKLHNTLLVAGLGLLITGIALMYINHPVASTLGGVCMSIGTPLLLTGLIMTIVRKNQSDKSEKEGGASGFMVKRGQTAPAPTRPGGSSQKLGGDKKLTPKEIRERREQLLERDAE